MLYSNSSLLRKPNGDLSNPHPNANNTGMEAIVSGHRPSSSTLNPNAPIFVPEVYQRVEDFSPDWWALVKSCSWFREYWLNLHPDGESYQNDAGAEDDYDYDVDDDLAAGFLPDDVVEEIIALDGAGKNGSGPPLNGLRTDVIALFLDAILPKSPKPVSPKSPAGVAKFQMKPAYQVNPKCTPRRINQPR